MSRFAIAAEAAAAHKKAWACPVCGGGYSEKLGRPWHNQHPADCQRELRRRRKAKVAAGVVTAVGPLLPCGCAGEHTKDTCSEFFDHVPEAEIGEEYTEVRDG